MKTRFDIDSCAALQIKSAIPASESNVKVLIDRAFGEVCPQKVITVAAAEHIDDVVVFAQSFLAARRKTSKVLFLIVDLILVNADMNATLGRKSAAGENLVWGSSGTTFHDFFSYYGELRKRGSYRLSFGDKCLYSVRLLQLLWRVLDRRVIVIFNAGHIRIGSLDLAALSARLATEGVAWLYTEEDERQGGRSFTNYLRLLYEDAVVGSTLTARRTQADRRLTENG